ncbi:hypothetical protein DEJ46_00305 [Streptomyces venezuelae]|uniref:Uncharacterized protein n=1 Tax=Streptomyces venezuelae TaxID=54571 RepID=A0A5P2AJP0_STRVZ|nr:hypothetical protein DEJ46_00305 [Streptomyces venezuelae]
MDDPVKDMADADSPTMRKRAWDRWTSVGQTRFEPVGPSFQPRPGPWVSRSYEGPESTRRQGKERFTWRVERFGWRPSSGAGASWRERCA